MGASAIRAVVFDFDGLIVDTESPAFFSWQEIYAELGATLSHEVWAESLGGLSSSFRPFEELERTLGRGLEREALVARRNARNLELTAAQPLMPGVEDRIAEAIQLGLRVGLASSSPRGWVEGHLRERGVLAHFHCIACREDVPQVKPDPALYSSVAQRLGVEPGEAVALEDSLNGVRAAKAAGLACVAIPGPMTRALAFEDADLVIASLAEVTLEALLCELSRSGVGAAPVRLGSGTA
jgi:HAD superfamily hydrolase (TIGR01509 family)